jgi:hypothetical protein
MQFIFGASKNEDIQTMDSRFFGLLFSGAMERKTGFVYTVKFKEAVFVLHCFQKKSKSGISTPKKVMEIIHARLKAALVVAKEIRDGQSQH